jgi:hypothetical protein
MPAKNRVPAELFRTVLQGEWSIKSGKIYGGMRIRIYHQGLDVVCHRNVSRLLPEIHLHTPDGFDLLSINTGPCAALFVSADYNHLPVRKVRVTCRIEEIPRLLIHHHLAVEGLGGTKTREVKVRGRNGKGGWVINVFRVEFGPNGNIARAEQIDTPKE